MPFCRSLGLHLTPSPHTLPHNQEDRLDGIPYEELGRRPLPYYASAPGTDGLYRLFCIRCINICDSQAYRVGKMGIASRHHGKTAPQRLSAGTCVGYAEEVLGVVDLHCIALWYAPYGMPEGMVRVGNNRDPPLLMCKVRRLLRAEPPGRDLRNAQNQQMAFGSRDLRTGDEYEVELLLFDYLAGFLGTPQSIMIGYGKTGETAPRGSLEDRLYLITAVGIIGMYM